MPDTIRGYWPEHKCGECGKSPVVFIHWGPLSDGEKVQLCVNCAQQLIEKSKQGTT